MVGDKSAEAAAAMTDMKTGAEPDGQAKWSTRLVTTTFWMRMRSVSPYVLKGNSLRELYASEMRKLQVSRTYEASETPDADCELMSLMICGNLTTLDAPTMPMPRPLETLSLIQWTSSKLTCRSRES